MARTLRKYMTDGNWREARRGSRNYRAAHEATDFRFADTDEPVWGDYDRAEKITHAVLPAWGRRNNHGGLLASPSNTGQWRDERNDPNSAYRARERRAFQREALADLTAAEALDAAEFWGSDAQDVTDYEAERAEQDRDGFYIEDDYGFLVFVGPTFYDHSLDSTWVPKALRD